MTALLAAGVRLSTPLAFAGLGELVSERAGMINIGLEGMILTGALAGAAAAAVTGSVVIGILAALVAGLVVAGLQAVLSVRFKGNQIIVGLALNLFAIGLTGFVFRVVFESNIGEVPAIDPIAIPFLAEIPWFGDLLFSQTPLFYLLLGLIVLVWWVLWRTEWGLSVRAVGDSLEAADASGVPVERVRMLAVLAAGALAGVAGAYLSIAELRGFNEGMSGGRGFIVIAAVIFGRWKIRGTVAVCFLFGLSEAVRFQLPAAGYEFPTELLIAFPYLVALVGLLAFGRMRDAPATLVQTFERGARLST